MILRICALAAAATILAASPALPANKTLADAPFELAQGEVILLDLEGKRFKDLVVGSDAVVAIPQGETKASISAEKIGYSSVLFVDENGDEVATVGVVVIPTDRFDRNLVVVEQNEGEQEFLCDEDSGGCRARPKRLPPVTNNFFVLGPLTAGEMPTQVAPVLPTSP